MQRTLPGQGKIEIVTVAELMARLADMDPDALVVVPGYELGVDQVDLVEAVSVDLHTVRERGGGGQPPGPALRMPKIMRVRIASRG